MEAPARRQLLVKPQYEEDIELKLDFVKKLHANFLKKLTNDMKNIRNPTASTPKLKAIRYTGIPESVYPKQNDKKKLKLSNTVMMKLRPIIEEIIYDQYVEKHVLPILKHVSKATQEWSAAVKRKEFTKEQMTKLLNNSNLPSLMKKLGYTWQKLPGTDKKFITERPEYVAARYKYLKRLKQYRDENRTIIHLDIFNITEKMDAYKGSKVLGANFVIVAISSATGLLFKAQLGDYLNDIMSVIAKIGLLHDVPDDSVIIFGDDNGATDKLSQFRKKPSDRAEMKAWLELKGIPYAEDMHKCELFDLCQKFKRKTVVQGTWDATEAAISQHVLQRPDACIHRPTWMSHFGICHDFWMIIRQTALTETTNTEYRGNPRSRWYHWILEKMSSTDWKRLNRKLVDKEIMALERDKYVEDVIDTVIHMVNENGLSADDLVFNEFDGVPCSDDESYIEIKDTSKNLLQ